MRVCAILFLLAVLAGAVSAEAASGSAHLDVSVQAAGTITFTIESVPGNATGLGTANVTTDWGTVSLVGPPPTAPGLTRTPLAVHWELSGLLGLKVTKANLTSSNCIITAQLTTAQPSGLTLRVRSMVLNASSPTSLGLFSYGSTTLVNIRFEFKYTLSEVVFDNTINFIATSN